MHAKLDFLRPNQVLIPIAILLSLIVIGKWCYVQWDAAIIGLDEKIELRQLQLDKYARIANSSASYTAVNRALLNLQDDVQKRRLFHASTKALSQAKFQNLVKGLAKKDNIDIRSTKVVADERQGDVSLLRLRIDAKAEIGAIRDFLLDLKADEHYIFVSNLEIRIINTREVRYYYMSAGLVAIQDS